MSDEPQVVQVVSDEQLQVLRNRYAEARAAGLSIVEAQLFRDSLTDVGLLRRCVRNGWTAEQIAAVVGHVASMNASRSCWNDGESTQSCGDVAPYPKTT
jgi:hypothetical protein